jgi:nicotinate-nucleotide adenylyltransferase
MRILVFGGSFNPPHIGHFAMADFVRAKFSYDRVILLPSFRPPHKTLKDDPGTAHRMAMLLRVCAEDRNFIVDDCEIVRAGTSYSIDSILHLIDVLKPEGKPGFLLGDDLVPGFPSWKEPSRMAEVADLIVASRTGELDSRLEYPHARAENERLAISSSMIRRRIGEGEAFRYLVPAPVYGYISEKGLYGFH